MRTSPITVMARAPRKAPGRLRKQHQASMIAVALENLSKSLHQRTKVPTQDQDLIAMLSKTWIKTKSVIFQNPPLIEAAFIIGVAHSYKLVKPDFLRKWTIFLQYYIAAVNASEYQQICGYVDEVPLWTEMFKNADSEGLIARAQAAAPKADWQCPVKYVAWKAKNYTPGTTWILGCRLKEEGE